MSLKSLRVIWSDVRGTALIEGAIALPVLLVLFFGVFEFSWFFYEQHRVSTGIRDAARYIARSDNLPNPPTTVPINVQSAAKNLATTGDTSGSCPPTCRVSGWIPGDVNIDVPAAIGTIYVVRVQTSFTPTSLGFLGFLSLGPLTVNIVHFERIMPGGT